MTKKRKSQLPSLPSSGSPTKRSRVAQQSSTLSRAVVIEDVRRKPKRNTAPVGRLYTHLQGDTSSRRFAALGAASVTTPSSLFPLPPAANTSSSGEDHDDIFAGVVIEHEVMPQRTQKVRIELDHQISHQPLKIACQCNTQCMARLSR